MGAPRQLLKPDDRGDDVAAMQRALESLGFALPDEEPGLYGAATTQAMRAFQHARGIGVDGILGPVTRRELADAAWSLGARPLGLETPMLCGDDVRALQDRLTTLGFDPGKTDGIFGPETLAALKRFQHEYGLDEDGICGQITVRALRGLKILAGDVPVGIVRERERMAPRPDGLVGLRVFLDPGPSSEEATPSPTSGEAYDVCSQLAALLRGSGAVVEMSHPRGLIPDDSLRARLANTLQAELILSVRVRDEVTAAAALVRSFGHARYRSIRAERTATLVAEALLEGSVAETLEHELATIPILRETRATAVAVDLTPTCVLTAAPDAFLTALERCVTLGAYGTHT